MWEKADLYYCVEALQVAYAVVSIYTCVLRCVYCFAMSTNQNWADGVGGNKYRTAVTFTEITATQRKEKMSEEMVLMTIKPVTVEGGLIFCASPVTERHGQGHAFATDQSQLHQSVVPWHGVTFQGRCPIGYSVGYGIGNAVWCLQCGYRKETGCEEWRPEWVCVRVCWEVS